MPYLIPMPFIGNVYTIITLKKLIGTFLEDIYNQKVDPFFGYFILNRPILFMRDPDLIKSVLIIDFDHFPDRSVICNKNDRYGAKTLFMLKDNDALVGPVFQYLVAGFETSGSTILYILYQLCLNEAIQNCLRDEILTVLENNENIRLESVQEMSFLDMVIKVVEKGIPIYISIFTLHYDPTYFPNLENLDPEQFSPKNKLDIIPCTYMPFGEEYRNCLGD
ncbi:hypothetical protein FQA39_LY14365 [Lamprigera yunnana]|nr:hypothetical protein FQA39_LY14365 [Lamprigera yunnana]